jgi:hypothetical protein
VNIWQACQGENYVTALDLQPWRIVEAQHVLSTRDLVDTAEEHDILESLLEDSKPAVDQVSEYLIFTPFRYPPLKYGSRFGCLFEPSLWYGAMEFKTALAEVAYYRRLFLKDTMAELGYVDVLLTAFQAWLKTPLGIDLRQSPFNQHRELICAKDSYDHSQTLGASMRAAQVEAFVFYSARTAEEGCNIAAFTPKVFHKKNARQTFHHQTWHCIANRERVEFTRTDFNGTDRYVYP